MPNPLNWMIRDNPGAADFFGNLGLGLAAMSQGGAPVGTSRFAQAAPFFQGAMRAPQQARQQAMMAELMQYQMAKAKAEQERETAWNSYVGGNRDQALQDSGGAPTIAAANQMNSGMSPLLGILGPEKGVPALMAMEERRRTEGAWEPVPGGQRNKITGEMKYAPAGTMDQYTPEVRGGIPGQVNKRTNEWKALDPTLSKVTVNPTMSLPPAETEFQKAQGKFNAEQYQEILKGEVSGRTAIGRSKMLEQALEDAISGTGAQSVLAAKKAANTFLGADFKDVPPSELATALSNEMALQLRNPAGGAGMPGAMSDADRQYLQSMTPNLGQTKEGRKQLIEARRKMDERSVEVGQRARDFAKKNGGRFPYDEFIADLADWSEKNPLFKTQQPSSQAGGEWSIRALP